MTLTRIKFERESVGYSGLLIWIGMDGHYHAADLCCPNCLIKTKPVKVDGIYAVCPTCEETYDISYGYAFPTKGKTKFPLRNIRHFIKTLIQAIPYELPTKPQLYVAHLQSISR
jgi:nitrite reductase/ring-hydroxylating ferredoxin subunit